MSERDLDLLGLHGQRQAAFGADLQAKPDGFADVLEGGGLGRALADATGDRRAFGDPGAGLVAVDGHGKFHAGKLGGGGIDRKPGVIAGSWAHSGGGRGASRRPTAGPRPHLSARSAQDGIMGRMRRPK